MYICDSKNICGLSYEPTNNELDEFSSKISSIHHCIYMFVSSRTSS